MVLLYKDIFIRDIVVLDINKKYEKILDDQFFNGGKLNN
jgi:hypothetical protein